MNDAPQNNQTVTHIPKPQPTTVTANPPPGTLAQSPQQLSDTQRRSEVTSYALPTVPGFDILEEIGRGGMGIVYRARDLTMQREVAVKVLQERFGPDSGTAERFLEESRITGQLQHPGIPAVYQMGRLPDGRPYLAMKLIKGRTLAELLKTPTADHPNWFAVFESICQAVGYAHSHGVIHRDLKPANVMVGGFGEVQVMDWGLAKILGTSPKQSPSASEGTTEIRSGRDAFTQFGSVMGTPAYMPPEQACGEVDQIDCRSDVFSLGAILCEILTGHPPYTAPTTDSIMAAARRGNTEVACARLDACGAERPVIDTAIRCLQAEHAKRHADANALAAEIAVIRTSAEERAREAEVEKARALVQAAEQRRRRRVQMALLVVLLAGAGVSIFYAIRSDRNAAIASKNAENARRNEEVAQKNEQDAKREAKRADEKAAAERKEKERADTAASDATREFKRAEEKAAEAILQKKNADAEAERAKTEDKRAEEARIDAQKQTALAEERLVESRRLLDLSRLRTAQADFANNAVQVARDTLQQIDAKNRCLVWDHLNRRFDGSLLTFAGHTGAILSVAMYPEQHIATASHDCTARVWSARTGDCLHVLKHNYHVTAIDTSSDGSRIATAAADNKVRLWDIPSGKCLVAFKAHGFWINRVKFAPSGYALATASYDKTARIWDSLTGERKLELACDGQVLALAWNREGSRIATITQRGTVTVWSTATGAVVWSTKMDPRVSTGVRMQGWLDATSDSVSPFGDVSFNSSGSQVFACFAGRSAWMLDGGSGKPLLEFGDRHSDIRVLSLTADDAVLVTGSGKGVCTRWDAREGIVLSQHLGHHRAVSAVCITPDGSKFLSGSDDNTAKLWATQSQAAVAHFPVATTRIDAISASFNGERFAVAFTNGDHEFAQVWETRERSKAFEFAEPTSNPRESKRVFLAAPGTHLVTTGSLRTRFVDLGSKHDTLRQLDGASPLRPACLSVDGSRIAVAANRNVVHVFETASRGRITSLNPIGGSGDLSIMGLDDHGEHLFATAGVVARVVDVKNGAMIQEFRHAHPVICATMSGGRKMLASGCCCEGSVRLWSIETGRQVGEFRGHSSNVTSICISSDGERLSTLTTDGTFRIWDVRTEQPLLEMKDVSCNSFSQDGLRLFVGTKEGVVRVLDFRSSGHPVRHQPDWWSSQWTTQPDPQWNVAQQKRFAAERNGDSFVVQRSFEQQARGVVALDFNQWDRAYWHFVAAVVVRHHPFRVAEAGSQWSYTGGGFRKLADGQWVERDANPPDKRFREESVTPEYVELFDESRQMSVRLYADRMTFKRSGAADFAYIRQGRWTAKYIGEAAPMPREARTKPKHEDD